MTELALEGIDGQHLWGFLTALGSLSLLDSHARERQQPTARLAFRRDGIAVLQSPIEADQLAGVLLGGLRSLRPSLHESLGEIKKPSDFTQQNFGAVASEGRSPTVELLGGLACVIGDEAFETTLCAANGASHQCLIQSMRDILQLVEEDHVRAALFEQWKREYRVPGEKRRELKLGTRKPTLRLDPSDERLYALRLSNPTTTDDYATELGAQALAIPAFGLLPVVPGKRPVTVASSRSRQRVTFMWPLWDTPATLFTVRSLVWDGIGRPDEHRARGVFAAFGADRVSGAKGKLSFAPSQGVW